MSWPAPSRTWRRRSRAWPTSSGAGGRVPDAGAERPEPARGALTPEASAANARGADARRRRRRRRKRHLRPGFFTRHGAAAPHDWLQLTGGAIGDGMPLATGAAVGAPGRRWSRCRPTARPCTRCRRCGRRRARGSTSPRCCCANRKYAILLGELAKVGANPGPHGARHAGSRQPRARLGSARRAAWASRRRGRDAAKPARRPDGAILRPAGAVPDRADDLTGQPAADDRRDRSVGRPLLQGLLTCGQLEIIARTFTWARSRRRWLLRWRSS